MRKMSENKENIELIQDMCMDYLLAKQIGKRKYLKVKKTVSLFKECTEDIDTMTFLFSELSDFYFKNGIKSSMKQKANKQANND